MSLPVDHVFRVGVGALFFFFFFKQEVAVAPESSGSRRWLLPHLRHATCNVVVNTLPQDYHFN